MCDNIITVSPFPTDDKNVRIKELHEFYCKEFGKEPNFFVRCPGRVNIIGEHVDYCGYPVLPMAIDQSILLAVGVDATSNTLQLRNVNLNRFDNFSCDLNKINIDGPQWYNYFLCGVIGVHEMIGNPKPIGMTVALSGNVPPGAGLSSSSALVSASVLATANAHSVQPLERLKLAAVAATCERYIGTEGGGMDQAISYLAKAGCAQYIEFLPKLNAKTVQLPEGACFVIAHSLAEKMKAASSDYNERVVECRLGTRLIAKNAKIENWRDCTKFAQLQMLLNLNLAQYEEIVENQLTLNIYTRKDLCKLLEITEQDFENDFLTPNTLHMDKFKVRQRALHVVQESIRVEQFRKICDQVAEHNSNSNGVANSLNILKDLMRASHRSLQELYECSHPNLDRIIQIAESIPGCGARLTGAGWGGCTVTLCDSAEISTKFIAALKDKFYSQMPPHVLEKLRVNFDDIVFATYPKCGAEIIAVPK